MVKEETWEYFGEGAKRAVDYLLNKYDEISGTKEKEDVA